MMNDNEQWDNNDIDFRWDMMNNEKQWIIKYDKFQKWYNMINVINNKIRNETKQHIINDSNDF